MHSENKATAKAEMHGQGWLLFIESGLRSETIGP